jgi:hypothetical protein
LGKFWNISRLSKTNYFLGWDFWVLLPNTVEAVFVPRDWKIQLQKFFPGMVNCRLQFCRKKCFIGRVQRIDLHAKRIFLHRNTLHTEAFAQILFKYRILCRKKILITVIFLQRNIFTNTDAL